MRILVHDFGGYPFVVPLSRALARRGHTVCHAYCGSLSTTPSGLLEPRPDDPPGLEIRPVRLDRPLDKFSFVTRWRQENEYGRRIAREVDRFRPDVVLSGNTPLDAQRRLQARCRVRGSRFVFWVQDLIGLAAYRLLRQRIPVAGALVGRHYLALERRLLRRSDAIVLITDDFRPLLAGWGIDDARMHVIENWAPLDAVPVRPPDNAWARRHGLHDKTCFLYSGTLGMKHNPALLLRLARHFRGRPDVRVVVVSQGLGADWLRERRDAEGLDNLLLLGFQPFEDVPDVLGAADVLVAVLEPDAGAFSVPSKVLTYLCARRALLLAVPPENLAARTVERLGAGQVVPPTDAEAFVRAAAGLLDDPAGRAAMGAAGRRYAERHFDLERVAEAFEAVLPA